MLRQQLFNGLKVNLKRNCFSCKRSASAVSKNPHFLFLQCFSGSIFFVVQDALLCFSIARFDRIHRFNSCLRQTPIETVWWYNHLILIINEFDPHIYRSRKSSPMHIIFVGRRRYHQHCFHRPRNVLLSLFFIDEKTHKEASPYSHPTNVSSKTVKTPKKVLIFIICL